MLTPEDLEQIRAVVETAVRTTVETAVQTTVRAIVETTVQTIVDTAVSAAEARAQEFARTIETNLLTAFHSYAKGQTARFHTVETASADLAIRVAALEDRVLHLETRRPPPQ